MIQKYFAFSPHKSGSTLLFNLLSRSAGTSQHLQGVRRLSYISLPDQLFNSGIPEQVMRDTKYVSPIDLDEPETIYGGFRFVPDFLNREKLAGAGIMTLVRDPRDALTSYYYSVAQSHSVPQGESGKKLQTLRNRAQKTEIDDFVLEQARHGNWMDNFRGVSPFRQLGKAWRYEDVIFNKSSWLDEILLFLELDLPDQYRKDIIEREDIIPDTDRPHEHVRQVVPGDHRRKLKPSTIEELTDMFGQFIDAWGYSRI